MKIYAISHFLPHKRYQRCPQCDMLFSLPEVKSSQTACCPRCSAKILDGRDWSVTRLTAMVVTMLLLMPFAFTEPLVKIRLLGTPISASLLEGIMQMTLQGHVITAAMVAFCTIAAPVTLIVALLALWFGRRWRINLRPALLLLERLKEWVMYDIYLVAIAVASIKVKDYADIDMGYGLVAYVTLTLLSILTLIHLNVEQLWHRYYPQPEPTVNREALQVCLNCHYTGTTDKYGCCPRCHTHLYYRRPGSIQKTWAALTAAIILLFPANLLPISIIWLNGSRQEDTIFTGIKSLASGNLPVAGIVFIASILVPFTKVVVLLILLTGIHLRWAKGLKIRIRLLRIVTWIGRWSMLDLFVISITMSLVNRDQLLAFTVGPAAFYFGAAVILTILAVEWLDSRLIWDAHAKGNAA